MMLPSFLQPRILAQALKALFSAPYTTKFPAEPFEPIDAFRGRPRFHEDDCIGCGACANVCPPKCIDIVDDLEGETPKRRLIQHLDGCIWCGQCARYCPTGKGIQMSHEYDCAGFKPEDFEERVEKELLMCEVCGETLAPTDQLRWLAKRLGPTAYANPTLLLAGGQGLGLVGPGVKSHDGTPRRGERMAVQCPKCRRKTAFAA